MTTTDKTGAKLVDSMRKTKEAAASDKGRPSPAERREERKKDNRLQNAEPRDNRSEYGGADVHHSDPYQGGRRIWPD